MLRSPLGSAMNYRHHHHAIRYDTRCCFNVRSKVDISELNLPRGTKNKKSGKRIRSEVSVNSPRGIRGVSAEEEKEGYGGKDLLTIGVASYGALGHVPHRLPTIYFFPPHFGARKVYEGNLSCQMKRVHPIFS